MAIANIKATLDKDIMSVWKIVVSLENYAWRSDLKEIEILDEKRFIEHTKDGYQTVFTISTFELMKRYEFDMDNENMHGHWVGLFSEENGKTIIDFTEDVIPKKLLLKPFIGLYLKRQQATYVKDLRKILENSQ